MFQITDTHITIAEFADKTVRAAHNCTPSISTTVRCKETSLIGEMDEATALACLIGRKRRFAKPRGRSRQFFLVCSNRKKVRIYWVFLFLAKS